MRMEGLLPDAENPATSSAAFRRRLVKVQKTTLEYWALIADFRPRCALSENSCVSRSRPVSAFLGRAQ